MFNLEIFFGYSIMFYGKSRTTYEGYKTYQKLMVAEKIKWTEYSYFRIVDSSASQG